MLAKMKSPYQIRKCRRQNHHIASRQVAASFSRRIPQTRQYNLMLLAQRKYYQELKKLILNADIPLEQTEAYILSAIVLPNLIILEGLIEYRYPTVKKETVCFQPPN